MSMSETIQLRCPEGPQRLLGKMRVSGTQPHVTEDNLIELVCDYCKVTLRKRGESVVRVVHSFNLAGELVTTEVVRDAR